MQKKASLFAVAFVAWVIAGIPNCFLVSASAAEPVDPNLKPEIESGIDQKDRLSVLRDMGVVQNKAMQKSGRFLLATHLSMDFSDGPYTMYGAHINPGFALSDFWEIYANLAPFYVHRQRAIVSKVESLTLSTGQHATITQELMKQEYGLELLWAPFYGKDSVGLKSIIRSDTFFKFGVADLRYPSDQGLKLHLGVGKTFFLTQWLGFRSTLSGNYLQTIVDRKKSYQTYFMIDLGFVGYF